MSMMGVSTEFDEGVRRCIPSEFTMISGSEDGQEAEEIYNAASKFGLPYVKGKEGGLCTSLLLEALYRNAVNVIARTAHPHQPSSSITCHALLKSMHKSSKSKGYTSVPQMTSSRPLDASRPFYLVPPGAPGRRRALIIGINYTGQTGQLRAPQNDAHNVQQFLIRCAGFDPAEILMLVDDNQEGHQPPTKRNIQMGMQQIAQYSRPGDVLVVTFSGHGGRVRDASGDEEDGYDSSLMPVDFATAGQIVDDDILKFFIKAIPAGVHTTMIVDACHCGSVGDLPYTLGADQSTYQIERGFNMDTLQEIMVKDKATYEAEQERKRQKNERRKEREAIRQRRAEEEAREAALASSSPGHAPTRIIEQQPSTVIQVSSQQELLALANKFGGMLNVNPEQAAALVGQGGGSLSTEAIMMTPGQAATFHAMHSNSLGGATVVVGTPQILKQSATPSSATEKSRPAKKSGSSSASSTRSTNAATSPSTPKGVVARNPPTHTFRTTTGINKSTTKPQSAIAGKSGVAALRSKFGG